MFLYPTIALPAYPPYIQYLCSNEYLRGNFFGSITCNAEKQFVGLFGDTVPVNANLFVICFAKYDIPPNSLIRPPLLTVRLSDTLKCISSITNMSNRSAIASTQSSLPHVVYGVTAIIFSDSLICAARFSIAQSIMSTSMPNNFLTSSDQLYRNPAIHTTTIILCARPSSRRLKNSHTAEAVFPHPTPKNNPYPSGRSLLNNAS